MLFTCLALIGLLQPLAHVVSAQGLRFEFRLNYHDVHSSQSFYSFVSAPSSLKNRFHADDDCSYSLRLGFAIAELSEARYTSIARAGNIDTRGACEF